MKIKLDENLPTLLVVPLGSLGHDVHTVAGENLTGSTDSSVWEAAQAEGRFWITQDMDFSDLRRFAPGTHFGILLVRLDNPDFEVLMACLIRIFVEQPIQEWGGCFIVASESKLRVIRP